MKTSPRRAVLYAILGMGVGLLLGWQVLHQRNATPTAIGSQAPHGAGVPSSHTSGLSVQSATAVEIQSGLPQKNAETETAEQLIDKIEAIFRNGSMTEWERALNVLFPTLLAKDRNAASRLVEKLDAGERREQLLRRVARAWAAVDFGEAVAWIASLPDANDRKMAFEDACFETAETDPAEAIHTWESLAFTADDHVMENLAQKWAAKDLDAARAWVESKPSSKFRDQAVARVAYVLAKQEPAEALAFVTRELPKGPAQTEAVISVLHQWAHHDLPAAKGWARQLPEGELAGRARDELAGIAQQPDTSQKRL